MLRGPKEEKWLSWRALVIMSLFFLTFVFSNAYFNFVNLDCSRVTFDIFALNHFPSNTFLMDISNSLSNELANLSSESIVSSSSCIIVILPYLIFTIWAKKRLIPRALGESLLESVPVSPQDIRRFHGLKMLAYLFTGFALDYYFWLYSNMLSHLMSMRSIVDTLSLNSQFIPEAGLSTVERAKYILAFDVDLTFLINLEVIVFGYIVFILFAWSLGKYLYYRKAVAT